MFYYPAPEGRDGGCQNRLYFFYDTTYLTVLSNEIVFEQQQMLTESGILLRRREKYGMTKTGNTGLFPTRMFRAICPAK
ncbi:MAG: hypothetical protein D3910_03715 [Candidatus Electrothrix sp. ATG2]|nr:hypothetical protein [Candidatus Electrothrix sp. ATG2]